MASVKLDRYSRITDGTSCTLPKGASPDDVAVGDWIRVDSSQNIKWAGSDIGIAEPTIGVVYKVWNNYIIIITSGNIKISGWGLTPGSEYFLGSNGTMNITAPTANGTITQSLGRAISSSEFIVNILDYLEN